MILIGVRWSHRSIPNKKIKSCRSKLRMKKRKEPSKKTSIYLSEQNIEIIRGIQEKYDLPLNRTVNMCLTKYLPEMRVWIWYHSLMKKKKILTFKDYINALKRLQNVAKDLEDIDNDLGGELSRMDDSDPDQGKSRTLWKTYIISTYLCWLRRIDTRMKRSWMLRLKSYLQRITI